jgi:hypothetical protein
MTSKQFKILGFFLIGAIAFSINTNLEINPYFQLYLTLLEAQGGVFLVIYLMGGLNKRWKDYKQN